MLMTSLTFLPFMGFDISCLLMKCKATAVDTKTTFMRWLQELNDVFPTLATDALPRDCN